MARKESHYVLRKKSQNFLIQYRPAKLKSNFPQAINLLIGIWRLLTEYEQSSHFLPDCKCCKPPAFYTGSILSQICGESNSKLRSRRRSSKDPDNITGLSWVNGVKPAGTSGNRRQSSTCSSCLCAYTEEKASQQSQSLLNPNHVLQFLLQLYTTSLSMFHLNLYQKNILRIQPETSFINLLADDKMCLVESVYRSVCLRISHSQFSGEMGEKGAQGEQQCYRIHLSELLLSSV